MMYELAHCLTSHIISITSFLTVQAEKDAESISNAKAMLEDRNYVKVNQHQPMLSVGVTSNSSIPITGMDYSI